MEFLGCSDWIAPQIDFLLYLQSIRVHLGPVFDNLFLSITMFGELLIPTLIMSVVYWCIDFRAGIYLFTLNSIGLLFSQLFKAMACVYRPWVLSDKIQPVQNAIAKAGGYSFPSGHSTMASCSLGGIAYLLRKRVVICTSLILLVLFVGFSRMYVGVHTPQDVVIGLLTGLILIFLIDKLLNWCEKDLNRYIYVLLVINILAGIILYYIVTKNYPHDYIDGQLLVNPRMAINIGNGYIAWILGLINGAFLTRRLCPFDTKNVSIVTRIIRGIIGCIIVGTMICYMQCHYFEAVTRMRYIFIGMFFSGFFVTAIYPYLFTKFSSK